MLLHHQRPFACSRHISTNAQQQGIISLSARRPPPLLGHARCRRSTTVQQRAAASGSQPQLDPEQQQQQQQQQQEQAAIAAHDSAEAQVLADDVLDAEGAAAAALSDEQQQEQHELDDLPWRRTARTAYVALAVALSGAGLLVAAVAPQLAAAGLKLGPGLAAQQAAVLVGCCGAAVLRAASLAWFLAEGAALGELGSWRYQRINVGLALAAAAAAAAALTTGWAGAAPWLPLAVAAGSGCVAALCASLAVGQAGRGGFYFASALGYGDVFQGAAATLGYLAYNVGCLAGGLMTALAVLGAALGAVALFGGGSSAALAPTLPWLSAGASGGAALGLLHKLLGIGGLLLGLQAWALAEAAAEARDISLEAAVKLAAVRSSELQALAAGHIGPAPVHVPLGRFNLLHAGFFAAAVVQGCWLAQAAGAGPGAGLFNAAAPLWGALYWSVGGAAAYAALLVLRTDYSDVTHALLSAVNVAGGWVAAGAALLYIDWIWVTPVERR